MHVLRYEGLLVFWQTLVTSQNDHSGLVMLANLVTSQDDHSDMSAVAPWHDMADKHSACASEAEKRCDKQQIPQPVTCTWYPLDRACCLLGLVCQG